MSKQKGGDNNKVYRITFIEDNTHKVLRSFRFSRLGLIIACATAVVAVLLFTYSAIAFTPLKTTIPGYPDAHSKRVAVANAIKIDSLESIITRWELYADNLSRVLNGEETLNIDSLVSGNATKYLSGKSREELLRRDSVLRQTIHDEEQFELSGSVSKELSLDGMHFFTPVKGVVSNGFAAGIHPAVDITAPANSVVCSALGGTVIYTGWNDASGNTLYIQHPGGVVTAYMHNEKLLVNQGDKVKAGTPVALLGSSGSLSTGVHLHFEIWYKGEAADPAKYISF